MKKFELKFLVAVLVVVILPFFIWRGLRYMSEPVSAVESGRQKFIVEKGDPIALIARNLKKADLIRSPFVFRLLVTSRNMTLQAGEYNLAPSMSVYEIAQALTHGTFDYQVTTIEGWRIEEIAEHLNSEIGISAQEFLENAEEGYMFPETYFVPADITGQEFASLMRITFDKKVNSEMRSDLEDQDLTLDQVVTLASIVEREANTDSARPVVAGILLKRWRNDWPLEADATVQYAVASSRNNGVSGEDSMWWPNKLTAADLEIDSQYNTRKYKGLTPGPICNPGLSSMQAVIYPEQTDYWFYITDTEGEMHYSRTVDEHNQNVLRYLR